MRKDLGCARIIDTTDGVMTVDELLAPLPVTSGMSGDVNLFFHDKQGGSLDRAEIECMIAEQGSSEFVPDCVVMCQAMCACA